jgi:hypothetical protein
MKWPLLAAVSLAALAQAGEPALPKSSLAPPVALLCAGKPIDVDIGHAAPCFADLLGEGKPQLLVGQFGEGKLRVYRNAGTAAAPRFDALDWFTAGGAAGKVPSG